MKLSAREHAICHAMLTNCNTNEQIARRLGLAPHTISRAIQVICSKLELADRVALLRWLYAQEDAAKIVAKQN